MSLKNHACLILFFYILYKKILKTKIIILLKKLKKLNYKLLRFGVKKIKNFFNKIDQFTHRLVSQPASQPVSQSEADDGARLRQARPLPSKYIHIFELDLRRRDKLAIESEKRKWSRGR